MLLENMFMELVTISTIGCTRITRTLKLFWH